MYQNTLRITTSVLGTERVETCAALEDLGKVHRAKGMYDEALALYDRALEVVFAIHGSMHPATVCDALRLVE